jgi:hypothetical protein
MGSSARPADVYDLRARDVESGPDCEGAGAGGAAATDRRARPRPAWRSADRGAEAETKRRGARDPARRARCACWPDLAGCPVYLHGALPRHPRRSSRPSLVRPVPPALVAAVGRSQLPCRTPRASRCSRRRHTPGRPRPSTISPARTIWCKTSEPRRPHSELPRTSHSSQAPPDRPRTRAHPPPPRPIAPTAAIVEVPPVPRRRRPSLWKPSPQRVLAAGRARAVADRTRLDRARFTAPSPATALPSSRTSQSPSPSWATIPILPTVRRRRLAAGAPGLSRTYPGSTAHASQHPSPPPCWPSNAGLQRSVPSWRVQSCRPSPQRGLRAGARAPWSADTPHSTRHAPREPSRRAHRLPSSQPSKRSSSPPPPRGSPTAPPSVELRRARPRRLPSIFCAFGGGSSSRLTQKSAPVAAAGLTAAGLAGELRRRTARALQTSLQRRHCAALPCRSPRSPPASPSPQIGSGGRCSRLSPVRPAGLPAQALEAADHRARVAVVARTRPPST